MSKEEYETFASCNLIEFRDIAYCFAAFETEESGVYGDSQDLVEIERIIFENREFSKIDKRYNELWDKWNDWLMHALCSKRINYANVNSIEDVCEPLEEGETRVDYGVCAINAKDFWNYLCEEVDGGKLDFDLNTLIDYLRGNSPAPSSKVAIEKVEILPEGYHKKLADDRHAETKPLIEALKDFLKKDLSGECTCTKRQACNRIFKSRFNDDERVLKRETGFGYLSFTREVSKALKQIDAGSDINRHENTEGFSYDKLPPCTKHPLK